MTYPDLETDSGEHERPRKKKPRPEQGKTIAGAMLAGLIAGGGGSAVLPIVIPGLYRPDPARGSELRALEDQVNRMDMRLTNLQSDHTAFLIRGPTEVRKDLAEIKQALDDISRDLARRHNGR